MEYVSHDRTIDGGECERYRPDFVFDAGTHMVVLEVDERQHKEYQQLCEQQRMVNISQAFGMQTLFIRYNPDGFTTHTGARSHITAPERSKLLLSWIRWALMPSFAPSTTGAFCTAMYLCYDNFKECSAFDAPRLNLLPLDYEKHPTIKEAAPLLV